MTGSFVGLNYACEEALVDYFIATLDPQQITASYYTGIGNVEELKAPAVLVTCETGTETFYLSNVYDLAVNIMIKEVAADTGDSTINTTSNPNLGVLTANIYNCICDPNFKDNLNAIHSHGFSSLYIQKQDSRHSVNSDTLISELTIRVIGCLSGSL